jgi:ribosomal-protein-alanine N-acetyltransferase
VLEDKVVIEFARLSDAAEIGELSKTDIEHGLGWKYTPERVASLVGHKSKNVVVARMGSRLVGFGIMTYHDDQANLDLLAVRRSFRRMKIGTQIVAWLEEVALTAGAFAVFVQVRAGNASAIAFYKSNGFMVLEKIEDYYNGIEAAIIMSKSLRPMFGVT